MKHCRSKPSLQWVVLLSKAGGGEKNLFLIIVSVLIGNPFGVEVWMFSGMTQLYPDLPPSSKLSLLMVTETPRSVGGCLNSPSSGFVLVACSSSSSRNSSSSCTVGVLNQFWTSLDAESSSALLSHQGFPDAPGFCARLKSLLFESGDLARGEVTDSSESD